MEAFKLNLFFDKIKSYLDKFYSKKFITSLFFKTGLFFVIYSFVLIVTMGFVTFSVELLLGGFLLIVLSKINNKYYDNKIYKKIYTVFKPLFSIGLSIFILTQLFIVGFSFQNNYEYADYTIVLGAGIEGERVLPTLQYRLDSTLDYVEFIENESTNTKTNLNEDDNIYGFLVMSGGQGSGESITEAEAMKRYMIDAGIPQNFIIKEEQSTDTYENLKFSKEVIENHSGKSIDELNIKIVSNGFHLFRAYLLSKDLGYGNVTFISAPIKPIFIPSYYIREFIGVYKTLIIDILLK